jgi:diadenosine tetraphosphatase ApaH/serine/threonine PP2A family protein phosphatase
MRWAIISDIHANFQALEAVLAKADNVGWDRMICLGDVVGYGAQPNECMAQVTARCEIVLMGNHDAAAVGLADTSRFNANARRSSEWTAQTLTREHRDYLTNCPYHAAFDTFEIVHATPEDPPAWHYLLTEFDAAALYDSFEMDLLFYGHTHVPAVFARETGGGVSAPAAESFSPRPECRYIVNVGSVGQPRDGDPRASFAVYDEGANRVEMYRVEYDIPAAQQHIRDAGLPDVLATRLSHGS